VHYTKISSEFEFRGHGPLGAHPQNVAFGCDIWKISAGCLVRLMILNGTDTVFSVCEEQIMPYSVVL